MNLRTKEPCDFLSLKTTYKPTKSYKIHAASKWNILAKPILDVAKEINRQRRSTHRAEQGATKNIGAETESNRETLSPARAKDFETPAQLVSISAVDQQLLCFPFFSFLSKSFNYMIHPDPPEPHLGLSGRTEHHPRIVGSELDTIIGWNF